jgi:CO/xanthine dehydrogenase Mo-binding subunit
MLVGRGSRGPNPGDYAIRTFGAQFAEVAVDIDTGEIRVSKIVASHDSGRIINPLTTSSQVEGGVLQGLGFAMMEGRVLDPATGAALNANLEEYLVPTSLDAPETETHMIDRADNLINNLGSKGVGEPPIIPTAGAIVNAIYHATGIRFHEIPLTRERVLDALEQMTAREGLKLAGNDESTDHAI